MISFSVAGAANSNDHDNLSSNPYTKAETRRGDAMRCDAERSEVELASVLSDIPIIFYQYVESETRLSQARATLDAANRESQFALLAWAWVWFWVR